MHKKFLYLISGFLLLLLISPVSIDAQDTGPVAPVALSPDESSLKGLQQAFDTLKLRSIRPA